LDNIEIPNPTLIAVWTLIAVCLSLFAVNGNWRLVFRFDGADAELVDYLDYH
jgi:hypothetical protein